MTTSQFTIKAQSMLNTLSISDVKNQAIQLMDNLTEEATIVFQNVLDNLESRMNETDFIDFMNYLDSL